MRNAKILPRQGLAFPIHPTSYFYYCYYQYLLCPRCKDPEGLKPKLKTLEWPSVSFVGKKGVINIIMDDSLLFIVPLQGVINDVE